MYVLANRTERIMEVYCKDACAKSNSDRRGEEEGGEQVFPEAGVTLKIDVSNVFSYLQELRV